MKTKNFLLLSALAFTLLGNTSCSKDNEPADNNNEPASISIRLKGNKNNTRLAGEVSQAEENVIVNATAFIFNSSGTLEGKKTFDAKETSGTITGLTAGTNKKLVVVANVPESLDLTGVNNYSWFANLSHLIDLDTQYTGNLADKGLAMSGEKSIDLIADENEVELEIARVVAKIQLGTVRLQAADGHQGTFELENVHIMKARAEASLGLPTVLTGTGLYGGIAGTASQTVKDYLTEAVTLDDHDYRYFYVFPNDNTDDNATLLTLEGKYEGETLYYAVRIQNRETGEYIKRNTAHTINITIKRPGNGTTNPELVPDPATLEVSIVPQNWEVVPGQNIEW